MSSAYFIKNAKGQEIAIGYDHYFDYDIVDDTILRIRFLNIDNKIYDLSVVSDRVNPDNKSDGHGGIDTDFLKIGLKK